MLGFSKKRFLATLGLSIFIWLLTVFIQAFSEAPKYVATFTQSKCSATGYPINYCLNNLPEELVYVINIIFWFWVIHLLWGWFEKRKS